MMNTTNKSFAQILRDTYDNEVKKEHENQVNAASQWINTIVRPTCIEAAKNLKNSRSFEVPKNLNLKIVIDLLTNKSNNLTVDLKNNDETIVIYW